MSTTMIINRSTASSGLKEGSMSKPRLHLAVSFCALLAAAFHATVARALAPPATPEVAAAMTIQVDTAGVTVGNLTPGSRVILFGVGREPRGYRSASVDYTTVLTDDDRDGVVRFSSPITRKSIWIAVDLESAEFVAGTGPGYPRRETTNGADVKRNNVGQLSKFENARGIVELMVVRAHKGAWRLNAAKNSEVDEANGSPDPIRVDASSFSAVDGVVSDELKHLKHGDVIAMIDPRLMEFYVISVNEE